MPSRSVVIFTPMSIEARAVKHGLRSAGVDLPVIIIGIGASMLPNPTIIPAGATIILAGFAGGLNPDLLVGDLVVDWGEGKDPVRRSASATGLGANVRTGRIVSNGQLVGTAADKRLLFESSGAMAVDMESEVVRAFALKNGCDVIGLRAITDRADEAVDAVLLKLVDQAGKPRFRRILGEVVRRPVLLWRLMRMGWAARRAGKNLARGIGWLIGQVAGTSDPMDAPGKSGG